MTLHNLLDEYPGELIRFFVLSTQYRRPIEYSEEELESKRKGLDTFYRLFQRVERICGASPYEKASTLTEPRAEWNPDLSGARAEIQSESLATACEGLLTRFKQAMDDDFNTAGAIAALFDFAGTVNRFIEQEKLDSAEPRASACADSRPSAPRDSARADSRHPTQVQDVLTATAHLIAVAHLIGLFIDPPKKKAVAGDGLGEKVMEVLIKIRQHLRKKKDFESADMIRDLLAGHNITLEDRPDGTIWRQE